MSSKASEDTGNTNANSAVPQHLSSTSLRDRLSRRSSQGSITEPLKGKNKLKLNSLSSIAMTPPVLLSPRGTPLVSPQGGGIGFEFFPPSAAIKKDSELSNSHLDTLLDDDEISPYSPSIIDSPENKLTFQLQSKLSRLPSAGKLSATPNNKKRNASNHNKMNAVRPHTTILENNFKSNAPQKYQQQEQTYLNSITNYRNRYKKNDDYYDNNVAYTTDDDNDADADVDEGEQTDSSSTKFDNELLDDQGYDLDQPTSDIEAIKTLSLQIGLSKEDVKLSTEYAIDTNLLLDLLNKNDDIQLRNTDDNANISERLEWQAMLQSVLTGDVVTGEKTRLVRRLNEDGESFLKSSFREDLWLEIRSKLFGRSLEEQRKLVTFYRGIKVDEVLNDILEFKLEMPDDIKILPYSQQVNFASKKVNNILNKYDACQDLWRTHQEMINDKPICATPEFISRIDGLNSWTSVTEAIERESNVLKRWVGNDNLDILSTGAHNISDVNDNSKIITKSNNDDNKVIFTEELSFVERILKEKDIEALFAKRLFATFTHWTIKAKNSHLHYHQYFEELGLPSYLDNLFVLTSFPCKLMKELIKTRLAFANKLRNSTMMMIDQLLEDLKMYIRMGIEVRTSFLEYCAHDEWVSFPDYQDADFDRTLLECIHYYLMMLNKKLLYSPKGRKTFRTFKESEELEKEWDFLQNTGFYLEGAGIEVATQFTILLNKLVARLNYYAHNQVLGPPSVGMGFDRNLLIRWYTTGMENFGQLRRKFLRFSILLKQYFENSASCNLIPSRVKKFFGLLKETNHSLFHSSKLAQDGIYIFVSEGLANKPNEVEAILKARYLGVNFSDIPQRHLEVSPFFDFMEHDVDEDNNVHAKSEDYVIVLVPPKALMWDGHVIQSTIHHLPISNFQRGKVTLLINSGPNTNIDINFEHFRQCVGDTIGGITSKGCSVSSISRELAAVSKGIYKVTCLTLESAAPIRNQCRGVGDCQELTQTLFLFSRDLGKDSLRNFKESSRRAGVVLRLINIAIEWLSFIVDDCPPSDPKTFRWSVTAMEFAMDITSGFNILTLDSEKFYRLKDKVAGCMSLLISHFDIMGARANAFQKTKMMEADNSIYQDMYQYDQDSLGALKTHMISEIERIDRQRRETQVEQQTVGRVLDDSDMENQLLTYLASSFSSVSIKWQKGKLLGTGTFGSVFAAVNLDTGGSMAVKEIKFADRQSIKTVVPAIKGEMSVLEMISHPNIIQFFGVEVHRDRVYIFMELCSGGSLSGLLEYGRIEDEAVIQLYTLQMLEALAYLHQFGIIHSDVKPDNILLDHMGVIKFVDFGSAKVIPIHDSKMTEASSSSSSINTTGTSMSMNNNNNNNNSNNNSSSNNPNGSTNFSTSNTPDGSNGISLPAILNSATSSNSSMNQLDIANEVNNVLSLEREAKPHALTGTPMYMSPETIKGDSHGRFGALDIWSLGCCVLEMATGRRPWSNLDNEFAVMYHIAAGHLPQFPSINELSEQGQKFLSKCLNTDPTTRSTAAELLKDPWIQAIRNEAFADSTWGSSGSSYELPTIN